MRPEGKKYFEIRLLSTEQDRFRAGLTGSEYHMGA
jgi:hypothetical protein